jgi:hypothetical protein
MDNHMQVERREATEQTNQPSDRAYASISSNCWNRADMQSIDAKQDSSLPVAFGNFELITTTAGLEAPRPTFVAPPTEAKAIADEKLREIANNSERIYKQEVPPAANRELHALFPELNSHHNRITHAKGTIYDHLQEVYEHRNNFEFFRSMVNTNAPWDFKSFYKHPEKHPELSKYHLHGAPAPLWVQNYGNFNYGAAAFALGLSEEQALLFAGAAQQGGTEKHPIKSPEGLLAGAKNTLKAAVLPNHGDSDTNDQNNIRQGYEWAQKHAIELGIN